MTREEFYNEIMKLAPSTYDANKYDFRKHLDKIFNSYLKLLDKVVESERLNNWDEIKRKNEVLIDVINKSIKLYYEGRHSNAFKQLNEHIDPNSWGLMLFNNHDFYRMRMFDEGEKHDRNGMFHIPFNKRTIVKTQRFSAPGYPCLYLGTSAYICWEEMLRPNLDKCYVSRFYADESFILYNLSLPTVKEIAKLSEQDFKKLSEQDLKRINELCFKNFSEQGFKEIIKNRELEFRHILLILPLILACMVKVAKPKDPFKPEYIIPQLFMEWVIEEGIDDDTISGIAYTSVHKSDDFNFAPEESINLVFPAFPPFKGKYSKKLCEMFQLTEPTCDELERAKCPYQAIERDGKKLNEVYNYKISTFGQLEARLKDEKKFPLKKIDNSTFGS